MAKKNTDKAAIEVDAKEKGRPRHSSKEKPRLKARFQQEIAPALMKELALKNAMAVPRLEKVVINMGMGDATQNAKILDPAVVEKAQITGQRPVITKAKKSIGPFKVREGIPFGGLVPLRGDCLYGFLD